MVLFFTLVVLYDTLFQWSAALLYAEIVSGSEDPIERFQRVVTLAQEVHFWNKKRIHKLATVSFSELIIHARNIETYGYNIGRLSPIEVLHDDPIITSIVRNTEGGSSLYVDEEARARRLVLGTEHRGRHTCEDCPDHYLFPATNLKEIFEFEKKKKNYLATLFEDVFA